MGERHFGLREFVAPVLAVLYAPLCVFYLEILFSALAGYKMTPYAFGFCLAAAALLPAVIFAAGTPRIRFALEGILLLIVTVVYLSQFIYYRIFSMIYIVQSIRGAGKAMSFSSVMFSVMGQNILPILLFLLPSAVFFVFGMKFLKKVRHSVWIPLVSLAVFLTAGGITVGAALGHGEGALSPRYLICDSYVQTEALDRFGLLPAMGLDVKFNILNIRADQSVEIDAGTVKIIDKSAGAQPDAEETSSASTSAEETEPTATEPEVVVYDPNIMDIGFNLQEANGTYLEMNQYFSQAEPTLKNEYTGMFKGKNLILLTAEGFSGFCIDPALTPALYKLSTEGFVFNNFYTPVWGVSTSDGEFVATTGLIPKSGVWSYTAIADNYMPFAFGNQFSKLGYVTKAYHDHTYTYYNRDRSYPTMGYDYKGVGNGLGVKVTWPESDVEMMQLSVPEYVGSAPFHVYYMTVSGHLEYNFGGNYIAKKNKELVEALPYSAHVKAYLACQIELDRALENLLSQLQAAGQLENTVIALSADHYPYGLTPEEYDELAGHELDSTFEMYKNTFILWSGDMTEPVVIDKYCSSLDIAPTLANLFGLEYDSRLYIGKDILSTASPLVIFNDRSFITDKIMYSAKSGEATLLTDEAVTEDYVESCIRTVNDKFKFSSEIISEDYYGYLFGMSGQ